MSYPSEKIKLEKKSGILSIEVNARKTYNFIFYICFYLAFLMVPTVVFSKILSHVLNNPERTSLIPFFSMFAFFLLIFLVFFVTFSIRLFPVACVEKLDFLPEGLIFHRSVFGFGKKAVLSYDNLKFFKLEKNAENYLQFFYHWRLYHSVVGKVKITYGLRNYWFGYTLSYKEADYLIDEINNFLKEHNLVIPCEIDSRR